METFLKILLYIFSFIFLFQGATLIAGYCCYTRIIGLLLGGIVFFLSGFLAIILKSFLPIIIGFIVSIIFKKMGFDPGSKTPYQVWMETYKPLIGPLGEPMNYIQVMKQITDQTEEEKELYINGKINKKLFWTVVDKGNGRLIVMPGKHQEKVIAWWICQIPYTEIHSEVEIKLI